MGNEIKIEGDLQTIDIDNSNRINRIGYLAKKQELYITFSKGTVYKYFDVPVEVFMDFVETYKKGESVGKYFEKHIRFEYDFQKI